MSAIHDQSVPIVWDIVHPAYLRAGESAITRTTPNLPPPQQEETVYEDPQPLASSPPVSVAATFLPPVIAARAITIPQRRLPASRDDLVWLTAGGLVATLLLSITATVGRLLASI